MNITECPRDAWQGHHPFIPTNLKIEYLNKLLQVGFYALDFGSFVSPKAMPQVRDTAVLVDQLELADTKTRLLAIVANERGAVEACQYNQIASIGFPFSLSETFQLRNTGAGIKQSFERVQQIANLCQKHQKKLVIYISMGFGNPYGDAWNPDIVMHWVGQLSQLGIRNFSLADTVGLAVPADVELLFSQLISSLKNLEFGAHFHTRPLNWRTNVDAAYRAGCRNFDGALLGYGGCPMAQDELVGNMPTEKLLDYAREQGDLMSLNLQTFNEAVTMFRKLIS